MIKILNRDQQPEAKHIRACLIKVYTVIKRGENGTE